MREINAGWGETQLDLRRKQFDQSFEEENSVRIRRERDWEIKNLTWVMTYLVQTWEVKLKTQRKIRYWFLKLIVNETWKHGKWTSWQNKKFLVIRIRNV